MHVRLFPFNTVYQYLYPRFRLAFSHTNRSQSRGKSHVSHVENEKDMQREIDELKKKLRRARRRRASFESESSSGDTEDVTYRQRSKTPPSETFSGDEEYSSYKR